MQKNDDATRILAHRQRKTESWIVEASFPDPTYDHQFGWKLDQFAMAFESMLLRRLKILLIEDMIIERKHGYRGVQISRILADTYSDGGDTLNYAKFQKLFFLAT